MFHVNVFYLNELVINLSIKIETDIKASKKLIFSTVFYIHQRNISSLGVILRPLGVVKSKCTMGIWLHKVFTRFSSILSYRKNDICM